MNHQRATAVIDLDTFGPLVTLSTFQLETQKVETMALTALSSVYHKLIWHSNHLH